MNIAVRPPDPMFLKLCEVYGFNDHARKAAERLIKETPKPQPKRRETYSSVIEDLCSEAGIVRPEPVPEKHSGDLRIRDIVSAVAAEGNLSVEDILSDQNDAKTCLGRYIAMYLARRLTNRSLPKIAKLMGGKHHTTVLHGCRRIQAMLNRGSPSLERFIESVCTRLEGGN